MEAPPKRGKNMKIKEEITMIAEGMVQILGFVSLLVLAFLAAMLIGSVSGNIPQGDNSTFSEWTRFLCQHPIVLVVAIMLSLWASRIWIRNERLKKEEEWKNTRPIYRDGKLPNIKKPQR